MLFTFKNMGYLKNIFNAFTGKKEVSKKNPAGIELYGAGQYELGYAKKKILLREMRGWVFACTSAIADEIAQIDIKLYKRKGDKIEEVTDSPILDTLYKVNDFTTKFDHFWLTSAYLELTGESPWYLEKDASGVTGIFFLDPSKLTPIADKKTIISGYRYEVGMGKKITIPKENIIFIKFPDPARPFRGLGTLEAAARSVDVDINAEEWNSKFFENSARPDSILNVNVVQMDDEQKKVLKHSIEEQYKGTKKSQQLMVLFGDMKLEKFATTQKDMDFLEQQRFTRDKIFGIFRVPKAVLAQTEGVNYACHSEDTEVLTENGFKKYWEVKKNEKIATVNKDTNKIEYHIPKEKFVYDYDGKMVHMKTKNVDVLITPNHKIWYRTQKIKEYKIEEIGKVNNSEIHIKANFNYDDDKIEELNDFIIPKVKKGLTANNKTLSDEVKINGDVFLEYLGYFLSEGGLLKETSPNFRYVHTICQKKSEENISKMRNCLKKTGFSHTEYKIESGATYWNVYGKAVNSWFRENCGDGCDIKKIPLQFKKLNKRQLRILFDALMLGDGSWDKREDRNSGCYATTSIQLADDVQEIALKLGYSVSIKVHHDTRENRKILYVVNISNRKEHQLRDCKEEINYSGKVWCFEVPNHIFITRRNGKITASGNSAKAANYIFARWTIQPKMERIIEQLNEFYVPMFTGSEEMFLDFTNPIPEDEEVKLKNYTEGIDKWLTTNEVRLAEGLPPVEGGDSIYKPFNLIPIDSDMGMAHESVKFVELKVKGKKDKNIISNIRIKRLNARNPGHKEKAKRIKKSKNEMKEKVKEMLKKEIYNVKKKIIRWSDNKKIHFWKVKDALSRQFIKPVRDKQKKVFEQQRKKVLKNLNKKKAIKASVDISGLQLNKVEEAAITIAVVMPVLEELFKESADETFTFLGVDMVMDTSTEEVQTLLKAETRKFSNSVTKTTNIAIKNQVAEGLKNNESIPQIGKRINNIFDVANKSRAEAIARTETVRYNSAATERAFVESGVVEAKEWNVEPDACQFCAPMTGAIVPLGSSFFDKDVEITGSDGGKMTLDYDTTEYPPLHTNCFIDPQIPIFTSKGWKQIGKIKVDDLVLTHKKRFRKVTKLIRTPKQIPDTTTIKFNFGINKKNKKTTRMQESLTLTSEHPILCNGKWVEANKIKKGDKLEMLANHCQYCNELIPYFQKYCNHTCSSKATTKKQWASEEHRLLMSKKISKSMKNQWRNGDRDWNYKQLKEARKNIKEFKLNNPEIRKKAAKSLGSKNYGKTWLEEKTGWILTKNNIEIEPQYPIKKKEVDSLGRDRYYFADFRVKDTNILIECDGNFWHKDIEKDKERQKEIEDNGFIVLRFLDEQINSNLQSIADEVKLVMANHNDKYRTINVVVDSAKQWKPKKPKMLYNFSVKEDESYIAKGFVVHNCRCQLAPIFIEGRSIKSNK